MSWFKVDDAFHSSKPVKKIPRKYRAAAVGLWILAGTWSAQEEEDGFVPDYMLEELCGTEAIAAHLVRAGLWEVAKTASSSDRNGASSDRDGASSVSENPGWRFKNWGKYQPTRAELEEKREKERIRKQNYRMSQRDKDGTTTGQTEGHQRESTPPDPTRPDPTPLTTANAVVKDSSSDAASGADPAGKQYPAEVHELCQHLADWIAKNGGRPPTVGALWLQACDRLIRIDGIPAEDVRGAIDWSQQNEFWRGNILSMPKLREKYDQLRSQAQRMNAPQQPAARPSATQQRLQAGQAMVEKLRAKEAAQEAAQAAIETVHIPEQLELVNLN